MEHECFENEAIAQLMNDHFVCIKVDREERPDLDDLYMAATVALSGSGGWPMTVFLTPEQQPFFAGTYFPATDQDGRTGLPTVLRRIAELWQKDRQNVLSKAAELGQRMRDRSAVPTPRSIEAEVISRAVEELSTEFDSRFGGFGDAPKFPPSPSLLLLLRHYARTQDEHALEMVRRTLDGMKNGGIYDHLGGGFARYSTDQRWLVPHFEKMLYDNAQLAEVYLEAYQVTSDPEYARVARETLGYAQREMQSPEGGFYSATDADTDGEEGKFFVWTAEEIERILGRDAARQFCAFYAVTSAGNWEGKNVLHTPRPLEAVAAELGTPPEELGASLARSRAALYAARSQRTHPLLDDQIVVAYNGLMLRALAAGTRVLGEQRYLDSALRAADFLLTALRSPDGGIFRTFRAGKGHLTGYLEDYAFLSDGLVSVYEAGAPARLLQEAKKLTDRMLADFSDPDGGALHFTALQHEKLIARLREGHDGGLPNANAAAARALVRLSHHFARPELRQRAESALRAYGRDIERVPRAFTTTLAVVDFLLEEPPELVLVGRADQTQYQALAAVLSARYLPNRVEARFDPELADPDREALPLVKGKGLVDGAAALYVCHDSVCEAPVTNAADASRALETDSGRRARKAAVALPPLRGRATLEGTRRCAGEHTSSGLAEHAFRSLGATGLTVSALGFGGYRIDQDTPEHKAALEHAIGRGVNLVDTSNNYSEGASERLVGEVLRELVARGQVRRDQVVVVSKIGYVQGDSLARAQARESAGSPFPEMVKYAEGLWHSVHPEWLEAELSRSLGRLGLETLDVCLLHNPEYFLADALQRGQGPLEELRRTFYARLTHAFEYLEREVASGRIGCYGVSSNTLVVAGDSAEATSVERLLSCARTAGGGAHHFCVLEFPANLLESGALFTRNTGPIGDEAALECARRHRVGVLINRPLNAMVRGSFMRLADPPNRGEAPEPGGLLGTVRELEAEFRSEIAHALCPSPGSSIDTEHLFAWAGQLEDLPDHPPSYAEWKELESRLIAPQVAQTLRAVEQAVSGDLAKGFAAWQRRYIPAMKALLASLAWRSAEESRRGLGRVRGAIAPHLPPERREESLSRLALWALESLPGVSTVLVGARRSEYVDDALGTLAWPKLEQASRCFTACRGL
jgi:uncharacterized protein YyaL (SSP411 family)/aryl-alcohol dehydrogenase-like predicted oxidoreductase